MKKTPLMSRTSITRNDVKWLKNLGVAKVTTKLAACSLFGEKLHLQCGRWNDFLCFCHCAADSFALCSLKTLHDVEISDLSTHFNHVLTLLHSFTFAVTAWGKRLSPRPLSPSSPSISSLHLTVPIEQSSSLLSSLSLMWEPYVCHDSGEREKGDGSRRGSGIFQLCAEVLSQQPPWCDSSTHSGRKAAEQYCLTTTGESSVKLICVRWHAYTRKPETHTHKHTISPHNHSYNLLCQRYSLADMGSDRAVTPIIFVLLSPGIWHLDEPIARAEIGLKTATKT